jgi:GDP-L-fucose synthase
LRGSHPSNLYGEHDNFNLEQAHVIPALLRKFYEAVRERKNRVEVWGDGSAKRDFLHCADFAHLMVEAALHYDGTVPMNLAYGEQYSIRDAVTYLSDISGFDGEIFWNADRPSGQRSREMSLSNLRRHLPDARPGIALRQGLSRTYRWLAENYAGSEIRL